MKEKASTRPASITSSESASSRCSDSSHDLESQPFLNGDGPVLLPSQHSSLKPWSWVAVTVGLILSFLLGRFTAPVERVQWGGNFYSPANHLINEYLPKTFDRGYGENTTDGRRIYFAGPPSPAVDDAWNVLELGEFVRLTEEEASNLVTPTAPLHDKEGGYLVTLDAYHQLHCLNFIRKSLEPEYYKHPSQKLMDSKAHLAHCINDLRQAILCAGDVAPMSFERTTYKGGPAYNPILEVKRECRNWDKINEWALERRVLNDPDTQLIIL